MTAKPLSPPHDGAPALATLAQALGLLRDDLQRQPVPPLSPRALLALQARQGVSAVAPAAVPVGVGGEGTGSAGGGSRWWWGAALTGLALCASLWLMLVPPPPRAAPPGDWQASGFVPVVGAERWQRLLRDTPGGAAWLVASELPRERLAALGLPFDPARAGEAVPAELLLHPSGEVLAVRVLHP
ncbi:MAG: hypothetical protein KBC73_02000 [Burkholderiaceae bacterium]|nr:hypothetical protein [Burkholderiaceae bacterium]